MVTPADVTTGHEIGHALDLDRGKALPPPDPAKIKNEQDYLKDPSEKTAVKMENKVRDLEKLKHRYDPKR